MTGRESERRTLQAKLEHLDGLPIEAGQPFDLVVWLDETRELFENLRETLEADPAAGRQVLRRLLSGPITVAPRVEDGRLHFDFAGTATYAEFDAVSGTMRPATQEVTARIVRGRTAVPNVWCPRGDSLGSRSIRSMC